MAKNCSECDKQLTFRDSFVFERKPVCRDCLKKLEEEQVVKLASQPKAAAGSTILHTGEYQFKTLLGYGKFIAGLGWIIILIAIVAVVGGIANGQAMGFGAALGGVVIAIMGISLIVSGQVISCFVSIERNTKATYELMKQKA